MTGCTLCKGCACSQTVYSSAPPAKSQGGGAVVAGAFPCGRKIFSHMRTRSVQSIGLFEFAHNYCMANYEKIYVAVILYNDTDGKTSPVEIEWVNGVRYPISKILEKRDAPPRHVGSSYTIRYKILVQGRERELYHEKWANRWFLEKLTAL